MNFTATPRLHADLCLQLTQRLARAAIARGLSRIFPFVERIAQSGWSYLT